MKKFILKIFLFFFCIAVIDIGCGWTFDILRDKANGGQTQKYEYLLSECKDDILILGSSRALHHYVSSIFQDSLGLSCYNAGEMGCGIIPAYVWYKVVSGRHKPKLVLYEVTPIYDYFKDTLYSRYLAPIRQYGEVDIIQKVVSDFSDRNDGVRMKSNLYRNNSRLLVYLRDIFQPIRNNMGYEPLHGIINPEELEERVDSDIPKALDSLKLSYINKLIEDTQIDGVPLIFIISPVFRKGFDILDFQPIFTICDRYDVPLLNYYACDSFLGQEQLFQDEWHLNNRGAVSYTQYIIPEIKTLLAK